MSDKEMLNDWHKTLLDSMRKKEDDVLKFGIGLITAIGSLLIATTKDVNSITIFVLIHSSLFICFAGVYYSLALGYTYRMFQLQISRIQLSDNGINNCLLPKWKKPIEQLKFFSIPPETISVFYWLFLIILVLENIGVFLLPIPINNLFQKISFLIISVFYVVFLILRSYLFLSNFKELTDN